MDPEFARSERRAPSGSSSEPPKAEYNFTFLRVNFACNVAHERSKQIRKSVCKSQSTTFRDAGGMHPVRPWFWLIGIPIKWLIAISLTWFKIGQLNITLNGMLTGVNIFCY